jgi:VWFA-related protein
MVQVDVVVHNSHGAVTGLTKDDFELFDKGKPQAISVFSVSGARNSAGPRLELAPGEVSNRPYATGGEAPGATVVLMDLLNSRLQDQVPARTQLQKFIDSEPDADRVALLALR